MMFKKIFILVAILVIFYISFSSSFENEEISSDETHPNISHTEELVQLDAEVDKPVLWVKKSDYENNNFSVSLISEPPRKQETLKQNETFIVKTVKVFSNFHYKNVRVYAQIPEIQDAKIRLYHLLNEEKIDITNSSEYNTTFDDEDNDGLIDRIEWLVPHLSEQVFEVEISIIVLKVQSYPTVGGYWKIDFLTNGTSYLIITPINETSFFKDLEFSKLTCGDSYVTPEFNGSSLIVRNWHCNNVATLENKVLTEGKHTIEFSFGEKKAYAYNQANHGYEYIINLGPYTGSATAGYNFTTFFNPVGSGRTILIRRIDVKVDAIGTAVYTNNVTIRRITSASGGTQILQQEIPKKNTSFPNSIADIRYNNPTVTADNVNARIISVFPPGAVGQLHGYKEVVFDDGSEIVLRPGEGIVLTQEAAGSTNQRIKMLLEWKEVIDAPTPQNRYIFTFPVSETTSANYVYHAFYNPPNSGKTIVIDKIGVQMACVGAATYTNNVTLRRITSMTGGTLIDAQLIPKKHTSSPISAVNISYNNPTVTFSGTINSRILHVTPCGAVGQIGGIKEIVFAPNDEKLILQPGEGIALYTDAAGNINQKLKLFVDWQELSITPQAKSEYILFSPRAVGSTANYVYHSFFNPVGSGKRAVIKKLEIRVDAIAAAAYQPITLRRITSATGGTLLSAVEIPKKHSSSPDSIIQFRSNNPTVTFVGDANSKILSVTGAGAAGQIHAIKELAFITTEKIILEPGEGIALYAERAGSANQYVKLNIEWDEEDVVSAKNEYIVNIGPLSGSTTANYNYTSFYNPPNSERNVLIKRIWIVVDNNASSSPTFPPLSLLRIKSFSGGTIILNQNIPKKHSSLPNSVVNISYNNPAVVLDGSTTSRLLTVIAPNATGSATTPNLQGHTEIILDRELLLRPGEGIVLTQEAAGATSFNVNLLVEWEELASVIMPIEEYMISIGPLSGSTTANYNYTSFYNPPNSGRLYFIKSIEIKSAAINTASYLPITIRGITSATGGTLLSKNDIPKKFFNSLNSTAEIRTSNPTVTSEPINARIISLITPGAVGQYGTYAIYFHGNKELVLRPGEGFLLTQEAAGNANHRFIFSIVWNETDIESPKYANNSTNSTLAGTAVTHNLFWTDNNALSHAIFSFDNCTGSFRNISTIQLTSNSSWSNFTVVINETANCLIRWCVYANDTANNWNSTSCQTPFSYYTSYVNVPPILYDAVQLPYPATYEKNGNYTFNITVNDPQGAWDISTVIFEFNGVNQTVTTYHPYNYSARVYSITKTDLPAHEVYSFKWYANDTQNQWGNIVSGIYTINKANPSINVEFSSNPITYPTIATIYCNKIKGDYSALLTLYRNGTQVAQGSGNSLTENILLGAGVYNYTCIYSSSQNYTQYSSANNYLTVNKMNANVAVYPLTQQITYPSMVLQYCTSNGLPCNIYRNESLITNNTQEVLAAGFYVYKANISDTQNYTNFEDIEYLTILKGASEIRLFLNGSESNYTYVYESFANITAILNVSNKVFYLEANFSGTPTQINAGTNKLENITNNFGAGVYNITSFWLGDQNYSASSKTLYMFVNKKPTTIYLWLNGSRENRYYLNRSYANLTAELLGYAGKQVEIWSNYSDGNWKLIEAGSSPLQKIMQLTTTGNFNFSANYSGNPNYTSSFESWIATVKELKFYTNITLTNDIINQKESTIVIGNCSCFEGFCNNVYIEIRDGGNPIENSTYLAINGSNSYYLGNMNNEMRFVVWNITAFYPKNYSFSIKCNSTQTGDVFSEEKMLRVNDIEAPTWQNNITSPFTPFKYEPNKKYEFNISWFDNVNISTVIIEHNFTNFLVNNTMSKNAHQYYFVIYDLKAGNYSWRVYANDTSNNWNVTDIWLFTVDKAPTLLKLYLNGTEGDRDYNVSAIANFTVTLNVSNKVVYLSTNISGWLLQYNISPLSNYTKLKQKGKFEIKGYFLGDENYTESSQVYFANVLDQEPPQVKHLSQNSSWIGVAHSILLTANWSDNYELDYAWLSTNETSVWQNKTYIKMTQYNTWSNFTWVNTSIPAGRVIGWRIYANDTSGNENATQIMTFFVNASKLWHFSTGGFIYSSPAVGDVNNDGNIDVVFASYDKRVYALHGNGQKIFEFLTNNSVGSSPSLASINNSNYLYIFVGSYDKNMYAINGSDGKPIWNYTTGGMIFSSPALFDINNDNKLEVIFGSYDKNLYVLDASNGSKIWNYTTGDKIVSSPAVVSNNGNNLIVFGSYDGKLYALNSTGHLMWQFSAGDKIESSPAIGDVNNDGIQEIAFGSYDNKTYLLNSSNGQLIWSYATNNWVTSSPVIAQIGDSKKIIIASHDSKVYCFNADGTINWTFTLPTGGRIQSSPSIVDVDLDGMNDVIVGSSDSRLYALNSEGKLLWFYKVNAYIFSSPSIADINADGNMDFLFGSFDKNQYALDPPSWHFFGGNERRTRIYDISPPDILHFEVDNESKKIASLWQEKFSNLAYAVFTESSTGKHQVIMLKGMKDWVNLSFNYKGFYYTIEVFDEYNNSRKIEGYIEGEKDIIPPTYFGSQSMTEVYSPRKVYSIFLNWTDESGIEEIVLEHNFTGEIINESVSSNFVISDLPAGFYVWKSFAKDYAGNWNETEQFYLKVEKAQQQVNLFLQNSTYPNNITAICDGDKFYRNSILVANQDYSILPAGIWNYTCVKNENQNYSTSVKEDFLLVKKGTPVLTLFANSTNTCPSEIKVRAFENNTGDEDVVYILSNDTHNFSSRNITLSYKAKAGLYNFTYTSSEGRNWTSNSITQKIFVTDATKPINIRHRRIRSSQNITIETLWEDACSVVSKGLVTENSLGFYRNHTIFGINRLSYTFSENELKNSKGCMWFGRVCMKFVNYKILAFDEFNNHNSVEGTFLYMFLR